ncbi:MAG: TonB family protein [Myxococcales bacterium]|nr:TonB family protein [Myxococcales bacterium]
MIEIADEKSVVAEENFDARYYSDKNRRPSEETRDTQTNLERSAEGKAAASAPSEAPTEATPGGPTDVTAQLEDAEASSLDAEREELASLHSGRSDHAEGLLRGDEAERGVRGAGAVGARGAGDAGEGGAPGPLSMREAQRLGAVGAGLTVEVTPGGADGAPEVALVRPAEGRPGAAGSPGRKGTPGRKGPRLFLDHEAYERIIGAEAAREETQVARRKASGRKGRWEKKLAAIRSSLETFTPEVRPGNQTALGTRAHPFGVFVARMHNRIHEIWGFGFISDLDGKAYANPMNDRALEVKLEIVVLPDGTVEGVTIVRPSGVLTFDVAAVDTVMSAGPYSAPPREILSGDGKVYLHWTFHRDERLCSPYFADPFILDNAGAGGDQAHAHAHGAEPGDVAAGIVERRRAQPRQLRRGAEGATESTAAISRELPAGDPAAAARVAARMPAPDDPAAEAVALAWLDAFERGDVAKMVAASGVPFSSAGIEVARDGAGLATVWRTVIAETKQRRVAEWKLLSPAGFRAAFGVAPPGLADGTPALILAVRVGTEQLALTLTASEAGAFRVVGFERR